MKSAKERSLTILRRWHERNREDGRADEKYALIAVAKADGATYQEIADTLGVSRQAVSKFMQERDAR